MKRSGWLIVTCSAVAMTAFVGATARAGNDLLYSWETGLEGWTAANATLVNASFGATDGTQSLEMAALTSGFKNDVGVGTVNAGPQTYTSWSDAAARIAAGDTDVKLEFDFSFDNSNANTAFGQLAIFVNSTSGGYHEFTTGQFIGGNVNSDFPILQGSSVTDGVALTGSGNTRHVVIPLGGSHVFTVGLPSAGSFYQVGFKSNGGWTGVVNWAIDNMRVTGANVGVPEPATMSLISLGIGALMFVRRRA